jgi:type IV pilus assembly protein PilV
MTLRNVPRRHRQSGMTLLEVLAAILVCSVGLVGLVGLQGRAIQYSTSAEDTSRAALLANEIAAIMVTSQTVALGDSAILAWQARVADTAQGGLPGGDGTINTSGNVATITITWQPTWAAIAAANSQNKYVTQVLIP